MKKVVGYIRYGVGKEEELKQRKAIETYCVANDCEVIEWLGKREKSFGDVAYGDWVGRRKIDAVVVASNEYVSGNAFEFYAYRCKLQMRGMKLIVTEFHEYAGYGVHRKIFEEFTQVLCRKELEYEPVRNGDGRIRKAAKGGYIGGQAPMGYKVENGKLVINRKEVPAVLFIINEKRAGRTKLGTVEKLNAMGYRTRRGGKFQISTVQGIWNNEKFYQGYYRYKGSDDWVKGQHEAIVSE